VAEERGGTVYAAYIKEQLAAQDARKASIETRGISVITTSGALVSLLFGLVGLLTGAEHYELPDGAHPWLYAAMIAFVIAAVAGIVTNVPVFYSGVKTSDLQKAVKGSIWGDTPDDAERRVAATNVKVLATAKSRNTFKGFVLLAAIVFEVLAVLFLALAIRVILTTG
jgi:hypothetical protein